MQLTRVLGSYQERFLEEYWQRKPLLIRGAFPGGLPALDPDSLAGLACQEGIESRIVLEKGAYPWQTHHGPFLEKFFQKLPKTHWTLLVQAVDRLVPEVSVLRESFRFIPNWRLDDIMISYAVDQGSVGPHTDNYDVFLIQAIGKRRWEFGDNALAEPKFIDGIDMKILETFQADQNHILEAGDMLYLPPGVAHHGVAVGECMTYSIGFRAPTQNELLVSYSQFLMQTEQTPVFYQDPDLKPRDNPGLITDAELDKLRELMIATLRDETIFRRWVGGFLTEPRSFHEANEETLDWQGLHEVLCAEETLEKVEGARFAYHQDKARIYLAVEGETIALALDLEPLVVMLCENETFKTRDLLEQQSIEGVSELLVHLWNQGFIRMAYE